MGREYIFELALIAFRKYEFVIGPVLTEERLEILNLDDWFRGATRLAQQQSADFHAV
jgi:hypothetical protein